MSLLCMSVLIQVASSQLSSSPVPNTTALAQLPLPNSTPTPTDTYKVVAIPLQVPVVETVNAFRHVLSLLASSALTQSIFNDTVASLGVMFGDMLNVEPSGVVVVYLGGVKRRLLASSGTVAANVSYASYDDARQAAAAVSQSTMTAAAERAGAPPLTLISVAVDGTVVQKYNTVAATDPPSGYFVVTAAGMIGVAGLIIATLLCLLCCKKQILCATGVCFPCCREVTRADMKMEKDCVIPCAPFEILSAKPTRPLPSVPGSSCAAV
jgi:hypothetical protein